MLVLRSWQPPSGRIPCSMSCCCMGASSPEATKSLQIMPSHASCSLSDLWHCRKDFSGGALLNFNTVAGTESSAALLASVWPALVGAGSSSAVPVGMWPGSSAAWPSPDADAAAIGLQLSQRLKRAHCQLRVLR